MSSIQSPQVPSVRTRRRVRSSPRSRRPPPSRRSGDLPPAPQQSSTTTSSASLIEDPSECKAVLEPLSTSPPSFTTMRHAPVTASTARHRLSTGQQSFKSSSTTTSSSASTNDADSDGSSTSAVSPAIRTYFPSPLPRKVSLVDVSLSDYSFLLAPDERRRSSALHLRAAFDSAMFVRRDSLVVVRTFPSSSRASALSRGSYGSDYYSLHDDAQGDSERFTLDAIDADYRVPIGYFGRDPRRNNRRGSDLAQFQSKKKKKIANQKKRKQQPTGSCTTAEVPLLAPTSQEELSSSSPPPRQRLPRPHIPTIPIKTLGKLFSKRGYTE